MQIDSRATIEGVPLTVIRTLFRRAGLEGALTVDFVRGTLHMSEPKAEALLEASMKAGFLSERRVAVGSSRQQESAFVDQPQPNRFSDGRLNACSMISCNASQR